MNFRKFSYRLLALCLAMNLLQLSTLSATTGAEKLRVTGQLTAFGLTKVNGETAISGQTLFSASTIETAQEATSIVSLSNHARLELLRSSSVRLSFDEGSVLCSLKAGGARISAPTGINISVTMKDGTVVSDSSQPALFSVEFGDEGLNVAVQMGRAELHRNGRVEQIEAGQSISDNASPQSNGNPHSKRKLLALLLAIGGGIAIAAFIFAGGSNQLSSQMSGGCVTILSPTGNTSCP